VICGRRRRSGRAGVGAASSTGPARNESPLGSRLAPVSAHTRFKLARRALVVGVVLLWCGWAVAAANQSDGWFWGIAGFQVGVVAGLFLYETAGRLRREREAEWERWKEERREERLTP
jgi:hypothetical protein